MSTWLKKIRKKILTITDNCDMRVKLCENIENSHIDYLQLQRLIPLVGFSIFSFIISCIL